MTKESVLSAVVPESQDQVSQSVKFIIQPSMLAESLESSILKYITEK